MKTISLSDRLFATITLFGHTIANISLQGVTSLKEIMARLRSELGMQVPRMARITIRNASQGWLFTSTIAVAPTSSVPAGSLSSFSAPVAAEATQLHFAF